MAEENKKNEGENEVKVTAEGGNAGENASGSTVGELDEKEQQAKKIKNLIAAVIILAGVAVGSLMVDVMQYMTKSGYSEKALKEVQLFEAGGRTWVAYSEPPVEIKVLGVSAEKMKDCQTCDPTEVLAWLKKFMPTVVAKNVDYESEEGKKLVEELGVKSVPAFVFNDKVADTDFYKQGESQQIFSEKEGSYLLNGNMLGLPVGLYLETPEFGESEAVLGNKDAKVKMIIYSDYQCPYSKMMYDVITSVAKEYGDKIGLVHRDMPLDFHAQAQNASMAAQCANEQGKFWEMSDKLYASQEEWGKTEGKDVFKGYARTLGLSTSQFNTCMDQEKYMSKIESDIAKGQEYGVSGTPAGFIGGQFISGYMQEEQLKAMIDEQL